MGRLGLPGTNRIGLVHYNTAEEIDHFVEVLRELAG
jgi:selenocysteine lyase/cysteine desulfurase